ncbi:hypothetical protein [Lentzea guizhouensis]|uniref:hypothetical protein n=1 Tax=Lentzea guizhouensis TaxID=1586287 RepID=UPI0012B68D49|nr:hypothetical protein [Lentzea guizhouensis]
MSATPIFDELYAKYVAGAPERRTETAAHRAVTVPAAPEPQPVGAHAEALMWPT